MSAVDFHWSTWTNKQQVAVRLADSLPVVYVEPITSILKAIRHPRQYKLLTKLLGVRLTTHASYKGKRQVQIVQTGLYLPFGMKFGFISRVNSLLYLRRIRKALRRLNQTETGKFITINYLPNNDGLLEKMQKVFPKIEFVYDCVDDYTSLPGANPAAVQKSEKKLGRICRRISISSPTLRDRFKEVADKVVLNTNVADYNLFASAWQNKALAPAASLNDIPAHYKLRVLYVGAINYKLDLSLLIETIAACPDTYFYFVGPDDIGLKMKLASFTNASVGDPVKREDLPSLMAGFDAGWIPFVRTRHTDSVFPMKFFEYLGAKLAVVSVSLPSLEDFSNHYYRGDSTQELTKIFSDIGNDAGVRWRDNQAFTARADQGAEVAAANRWENRLAKLIDGL